MSAILQTEGVVQAAIARLRQIAPIGEPWGPSLTYPAITAIQAGDLGYLPVQENLLNNLPAVLVMVQEAVLATENLSEAPPWDHFYQLRFSYVRRWTVDEEVVTAKHQETSALADAFLIDRRLNGISTGLPQLGQARTTKVEFDTPEEAVISSLGISDIFATAFTVTVTGYEN
ncbi:MAG: hypothetical protein DWQ01_08605 [Planctomycetota bacterium]|nr:MAG: hypothetical protein DWQ01_08605 [Planctomycetota bacterium]